MSFVFLSLSLHLLSFATSLPFFFLSFFLSHIPYLVVVETDKVRHRRLARRAGPSRGRDRRHQVRSVAAAAPGTRGERPERPHKLVEAEPLRGRGAARRAGLRERQVDVGGGEPERRRLFRVEEPGGADELREARSVDLGRPCCDGGRESGDGGGACGEGGAGGPAGSVGSVSEEHGSELLLLIWKKRNEKDKENEEARMKEVVVAKNRKKE